MEKLTSEAIVRLGGAVMLYTGVDLHRSFSYVTTVNDKGKIGVEKKLPSNGEMMDFLRGFDERMEVLTEATQRWYWACECLGELDQYGVGKERMGKAGKADEAHSRASPPS